MEVKCIQTAYDIVTGEKRFTEGNKYPIGIDKKEIVALDDKEEWRTISTGNDTSSLYKNKVFINHFTLMKTA